MATAVFVLPGAGVGDSPLTISQEMTVLVPEDIHLAIREVRLPGLLQPINGLVPALDPRRPPRMHPHLLGLMFEAKSSQGLSHAASRKYVSEEKERSSWPHVSHICTGRLLSH